jgi:hypothetical protein
MKRRARPIPDYKARRLAAEFERQVAEFERQVAERIRALLYVEHLRQSDTPQVH